MAGLYDTTNGYVDPTTGMWVSTPPDSQPGQGNASWNPLRGIGNAIIPNAVGPNPPSAYGPLQTPQPPQPTPPQPQPPPPGAQSGPPPAMNLTAATADSDQAKQLAALGIDPQQFAQAQAGAIQGQPPGAAQVASGATPQPPAPPQQGPQQTPSAAPSGTPEGPVQAAMTSGAAYGPSPSKSDYSTASPPPDAMRPIVDAAAQKYGIPAPVAYWMGSHESGWDPTAVGSQTSQGKAKGAWQFMDATAKDYNLTDPMNFAASTDAAMHKMSDLAKANGGDWTKAVQQYGTFSTGQGPDRDAQAKAGFQQYMGQQPPAQAAAPVLGQTPKPAAPSLPDLTQSPTMNLPYPNIGQGNKSEQLLALASGLLQGPSLSIGMGKGLQAMLGERQQDRAAQQTANSNYMQMMAAQQMNAYRADMLGQRQQTINQQGNSSAGQPMIVSDGQGGQQVVQRQKDGSTVLLPGMTPALLNSQNSAARVQLAQQSLTNRFNPDIAARVAGAQESAKTANELADKDIANTLSSQGIAQDQQSLNDINTAQATIAKNPSLMGPTLASRWSRWMAENGISGDTSDLNVLQKTTADQRNGMLQTLTNGHVGGIRSAAEVSQLSQAVADVGHTNPDAANFILNMQKAQIQAKQAWRQTLTDQLSDDPDSLKGRVYTTSKAKFFNDYYQEHPLPEYQPSNASAGQQTTDKQPASQQSTAPALPPGVTRVIRYDAQGNQIQ